MRCMPFQNVYFRKLPEEDEFMHADFSLGAVDLILNDPPCNVRGGRADYISDYDVLNFESVADLLALCNA